ncbi:hypothetical protein NPIL_115871, partial [Nephila pilipes]
LFIDIPLTRNLVWQAPQALFPKGIRKHIFLGLAEDGEIQVISLSSQADLEVLRVILPEQQGRRQRRESFYCHNRPERFSVDCQSLC